MTVEHETGRGQSEADTLADLTAMIAAAEADKEVKDHLGPKYLAMAKADLAHLESLAHAKGSIQHDKLAAGEQLHALAAGLVDVIADVRDMANGEVTGADAHALGQGVDLRAEQPAKMASIAHGMVTFLKSHHDVGKKIHIDAQHMHDLAHEADAIDHAATSHTSLTGSSKSDTHARTLLAAQCRAAAHHIRVKARLTHRHDAAKLAAFESPVGHHRVTHRASAPAPASPAPSTSV
jgi:hypothetical protein